MTTLLCFSKNEVQNRASGLSNIASVTLYYNENGVIVPATAKTCSDFPSVTTENDVSKSDIMIFGQIADSEKAVWVDNIDAKKLLNFDAKKYTDMAQYSIGDYCQDAVEITKQIKGNGFNISMPRLDGESNSHWEKRTKEFAQNFKDTFNVGVKAQQKGRFIVEPDKTCNDKKLWGGLVSSNQQTAKAILSQCADKGVFPNFTLKIK